MKKALLILNKKTMGVRRFILMLAVFVCSVHAFAQSTILAPEKAMALALEHNYSIKISKSAVAVANNNKNILNSGYLPSLSANANGSIDRQNTEGQLANGDSRIANGVETRRYNAALNLNYVLFDGLGRRYNYKRLKEEYQLSALEARETIETTVLQLFTVYYSVAQLLDNTKTLEETLSISRARLKRANYQFEYGQNTKLDVLNADVDSNNDSINLINIKQELQNAKRDLNFLLGNAFDTNFEVDTTVHFLPQLNKDLLLEKVKQNNVRLLQADRNLAIQGYGVKINKAQFLPRVGLVGSYGWNESTNNSPLAFLLQNTNSGVSGGVNITWNLFDGGSAITNIKNAKIRLELETLQKEQLVLDLERDFYNAWDDYQNKLKVYHIRSNHIATSKRNFDRTNAQLKIGQINSILFRQAQINLTNAILSKNQAKYQAKIAELEVLRLSGELLNIDI
jgi:outer membrane protein TolC